MNDCKECTRLRGQLAENEKRLRIAQRQAEIASECTAEMQAALAEKDEELKKCWVARMRNDAANIIALAEKDAEIARLRGLFGTRGNPKACIRCGHWGSEHFPEAEEYCSVSGCPCTPSDVAFAWELRAAEKDAVLRAVKLALNSPLAWVDRVSAALAALFEVRATEATICEHFGGLGSTVTGKPSPTAEDAFSKGRPRPAGPQGSDAGNVAEPRVRPVVHPVSATRPSDSLHPPEQSTPTPAVKP